MIQNAWFNFNKILYVYNNNNFWKLSNQLYYNKKKHLMNKELLIENLEKKNNIILYFNSKGCGPCKQAKPIVKKIVESRKAHFYSDVVEGDTHSQALEQFCKVEFYPTLVIIENNEINRYVGLNQIKTL